MHQIKTRYIIVTGGVLSGLGKGTITSSIGAILQAQGLKISAVKIDPYINIDAGTMRPTEHGEVFVTDDGGETDQDLGNYERFLQISLPKKNSITTGQVYSVVIQKERNLEFDGKCVEVIPHIPQEVVSRIKAANNNFDIVLVEIGGTIGDYQSILFLEAVREMKRNGNNVYFVHVVYLPTPSHIGEMKTKPAQHSVRELMASGIMPDFIVGRSEKQMDDVRKEKLALFCNVNKEDIISAPDVDSIYKIPSLFEQQGFTKKLLEKMNLPYKEGKLKEWDNLSKKIIGLKNEINIGIVGKYFNTGNFVLEDSYISVIEAVKHAAFHYNLRPHINWIDSKSFENKVPLSTLNELDGIIVPGGFGHSGVEGKIMAIKYARENNIPYLGLCYGMQLAVIEFARSVCNLKGANTTEIDANTKYPVIDILSEQVKNIKSKNYGGTMRLGAYTAKLVPNSMIQKLYNKSEVSERHRHRYEVNPKFIDTLEKNGIVFSGSSPDRKLMEFMEIPKNDFFVGTQAHPEFKSAPLNPHPLFLGLINAANQRRMKKIPTSQ